MIHWYPVCHLQHFNTIHTHTKNYTQPTPVHFYSWPQTLKTVGIFNSTYWEHSEMAKGETDNYGSTALMVKRRKCIQYQSPTCSIMSTYWECWDMMSLRSNLTPVIICSSNSVFMDWLATVLYTGLRNSWAVLIVWWEKKTNNSSMRGTLHPLQY